MVSTGGPWRATTRGVTGLALQYVLANPACPNEPNTTITSTQVHDMNGAAVRSTVSELYVGCSRFMSLLMVTLVALQLSTCWRSRQPCKIL